MQYWVYMLECHNGAYYTGYTTDLIRRYREHTVGTVKCKYTRSFKPSCVAQCWIVDDKAAAMRIERLIKKMHKKKKQQLILNPDILALPNL